MSIKLNVYRYVQEHPGTSSLDVYNRFKDGRVMRILKELETQGAIINNPKGEEKSHYTVVTQDGL